MLGTDAGFEDLLRQQEERCIAHVDMDCFYCEVERQRNPRLRGVPMAVLQYNPRDPRTVRAEEERIFNESDGSIIAVSYEARAKGVTRIMRGKEARRQCPELVCVQVPVAYSKADLAIYKEAGRTVIDVLARFGESVFRASIDEAYVDISASAAALARRVSRGDEALLPPGDAFDPGSAHWTWVVGVDQPDGCETLSRAEVRNGHAKGRAQPDVAEAAGAAGAAGTDGGSRGAHMQALLDRAVRQQHESRELQARAEAGGGVGAVARWWRRPAGEWARAELLLACGARLVSQMRAAVATELGYSCSAGIAHSMTLAKLGSSMHKPSMQTLLPSAAMSHALRALPIERIKGLGGDVLGCRLKVELGVSTVGDLAAIPLATLISRFGSKSTNRASKGSGAWLYRIARGLDLEPVKDEPLQQSHGVGKNFLRSKTGVLCDRAALRHWLSQLCTQLVAILRQDEAEHGRVAAKLSVHWAGDAAAAVYAHGRTRSVRMPLPYSAERLVDATHALIDKETTADGAPLRVAVLSVSASGLHAPPAGTARIDQMMRRSCGAAPVRALAAPTLADASAYSPHAAPPRAPDAVRQAAPASPARAPRVDLAPASPYDAPSWPCARHSPTAPRPPVDAVVDLDLAADATATPLPAAPAQRAAAATTAACANCDGATASAAMSGRTPGVRPAAPSPYVRLSVHDLDASTLSELPEHVRRQLLAELDERAAGTAVKRPAGAQGGVSKGRARAPAGAAMGRSSAGGGGGNGPGIAGYFALPPR
ncbi:hypothetical protein KFE25_008313 [Diacronema lutheri]|uniref:DNA polymerase eta n=1 Tax=Diacronema lutheri TaxID=2081491 RepID=A0A8J5XNI9_DIALT|nr:hypothetical protein KFE25_008313 [Diacronema lutheri]